MCLPFFHVYKPGIDSNGFIYCIKCGEPKYIGFPKCTHHNKLETVEIIHRSYSLDSIKTDSITYIQQCPNCGKLFNTKINE